MVSGFLDLPNKTELLQNYAAVVKLQECGISCLFALLCASEPHNAIDGAKPLWHLHSKHPQNQEEACGSEPLKSVTAGTPAAELQGIFSKAPGLFLPFFCAIDDLKYSYWVRYGALHLIRSWQVRRFERIPQVDEMFDAEHKKPAAQRAAPLLEPGIITRVNAAHCSAGSYSCMIHFCLNNFCRLSPFASCKNATVISESHVVEMPPFFAASAEAMDELDRVANVTAISV